jgi:hypothetical protein
VELPEPLAVALAVLGAVWVMQAFFDIDDNREGVCGSFAALAADRPSPAMTPAEASSRAQDIFEQAELGRDRQLAEAVGDYGRALSSGDPARVQRTEAAVERLCDP